MTTPNYVEIQDAAGAAQAYLTPNSDGIKAEIEEELNGNCELTLEIPLTSAKWQYITAECKIIADGKEFVVLVPDAIDITRDGQKLWGKVRAQESWKLLNKEYVSVANDGTTPSWSQVTILSGGDEAGGYPKGSAGSALTYLLDGSGWTLLTCDVTGTYDLETEKENLLSNIQEVQSLWGGYLVWDSINKTLSLRDEALWQNYTGYQIRYTKNLKGITKTINNNLVTRLYPFGYDDLNISSVTPGGGIYVDNTTYTSTIYEGIYTNQDIGDATQLLAKATAELETLSRPKVSYEVKMLALEVLPKWAHESKKLGDMIDVIDEDLDNTNDRVRLIYQKYNLFKRWECEVKLGDPLSKLATMIKSGVDAGNFVKDSLKPNLGVANILKGFVDTFATTINGASGGYECVDGVATWYELDEYGVKTGKMVRLTPGGMYISTNGGVDLDLAMTGDGILANTIICSALYALSSEDGYTKMVDSGIKVYDNLDVLRVHLGQYVAGKFGLKLWDSTGSTVILDEDGIMQTWQDGRTDNVDATHGLLLNVYLPAETKAIHKAILRFKLQAFRAYETGSAGGSESAKTSGSSSASSSGSSSQETSGNSSLSYSVQNSGGRTGAAYLCGFGTDDYDDDHNHGIPDGTVLTVDGGGTVTFVELNRSHDHGVADHYHYINHTHQNPHVHAIPHTHDVNLSTHTHDIDYGIYEDTSATGVTIKINSTDRTSALGGPFYSGQDNININALSDLVVGQWNTIELGSTQLGRIDASVFIQAKMGV